MEQCLEACRNCEKEMGDEHPCSLTCFDCNKICEFLLATKINNSLLDIGLLDVCSNACNLCIVECSKHMEHHKVCAECVVACYECVEECNQMKIKIMED